MRNVYQRVGLIGLMALGLAGCAISNHQPTTVPNNKDTKPITQTTLRNMFKATFKLVMEVAENLPTPTPISPTYSETPLPETAANVPPNGILASPIPSQPTKTSLPDELIPESLLITNLVPFTHEPTGVSGLRPDNWTLFSGDESLQISSHPNAPDGFIVLVKKGSPEDLKLMSQFVWMQMKSPDTLIPPAILEEQIDTDGNGTLLMRMTTNPQGSTTQIEMINYTRISMTPNTLLIITAIVPSELFPQEEEFIREMVDSITID